MAEALPGVLFEPIDVGTMHLRNRICVPTHAAGAGRILGSEAEAERFIAYYVRRARGDAGWIGGSSTFLRSPLIPGYQPSGVGAVVRGSHRHPLFVERHKRYMDALHEAGACGTIQMIIQGGLPHGASPAVSGFVSQDVPHALTRGEIAEVVEVLDPAPDWARAPMVGTIPHVCLRVDDVEESLARAEALGGGRLWPQVDRLGSTHAIYLTDPDGNVVELLDAPVSAIASAFHKYFPGAKP